MPDLKKDQSTPQSQPPSLKKSNSSSKNQSSIASFFQKKPIGTSRQKNIVCSDSYDISKTSVARATERNGYHGPLIGSSSSLTPAPSSDAFDPSTSPTREGPRLITSTKDRDIGLPSPITPVNGTTTPKKANDSERSLTLNYDSPSRKAKKKINYAESSAEDEDDGPVVGSGTQKRASKRRKVSVSDDDDDDIFQDSLDEVEEVGEDDFIVPDASEDEVASRRTAKRKRSSKPSAPALESAPGYLSDIENELPMPTTSTAQQWNYDPDNVQPLQPRTTNTCQRPLPKPEIKQWKAKAHTKEPEQRHPWLANVTDVDQNPPGHPDYDSRTLYIPPYAWEKFSPFEKQYWEIKQKYWDTIVFFKKGKFYELYENDATVGHQLFDLKLTDRVNMRMVGVPEMSLDGWANQFVAKGYKIARVDQQENALAKEMRERDNKENKKGAKENKVIRRELACVLTGGTLVDAGMLQDDMATYCVSIKEARQDDSPKFGIAFTDAATGQFFLTDFVDDVDMTKFETFIAQTRPQELLLEKSCVSPEAMRILKNSTSPTTIWNHLKPGKEFLTADHACRELDANSYFSVSDRSSSEKWPNALREAKDKDLVMSAFGALIFYLKSLKIERELLTIGNFSWYDPIKKASNLVLDGKTLINLEVFANSYDGGSNGTLFALLNRCITPFGKRMFKQWVCHPLMDIVRINARLDAVEVLLADRTILNNFTDQLARLPDLERIISRIHAGSCKAQEFARVLESFEQIDYTMSLLAKFGSGEGVIGHLISSMPDLKEPLSHWKTAFDHKKAKDAGLLIPEPGVEEDFDRTQEKIEKCLQDLSDYLASSRKLLKSNAVEYRDNGKEIYQLEVPAKIKSVPKSWDQMSATQKVKRYYSPELRTLVRRLQEAQETHSQIVKEVSGRFFARFDEDYATWLAATRVIANLDCLLSLAKASAALGTPSCRPDFIDADRSIINFEDLRHPCMLSAVDDFIPNSVSLGGSDANIALLTGANAAGKSTVLRMTCIAVIMAQLGCYVPCVSATLTPCDRIMSRLGANDNIFAAQSTFFVELTETKKILSEASPRSLVILDELGRGTSSYDGLAVASAVLHHIATHIGALGFFATHYHSLASEYAQHPEIRNMRMQIHVDDENRQVTFLYKLEDGVAEGSFGMHCASMCGIPDKVVEAAEHAAREWEHTGKLKEGMEIRRKESEGGVGSWLELGWLSDVAGLLEGRGEERGLDVLRKVVETW